jgi:hypothetical protein
MVVAIPDAKTWLTVKMQRKECLDVAVWIYTKDILNVTSAELLTKQAMREKDC